VRSDANSRDTATTPHEKASACRSRSLRRCHHKSASAKGPERGQNSNRKVLLGPTNCRSKESSPATRKACLQRIQPEGGTTHMNGHAPWAIPLPSHLTVEESTCVYLEAHREGRAAILGRVRVTHELESQWWPSYLCLVRHIHLHFLDFCFLQPRFVLGLVSVPYLQWSACPPVASLVVARCAQSFSTTSPVCGGSLKHPLAHEHGATSSPRPSSPPAHSSNASGFVAVAPPATLASSTLAVLSVE